MYAGQQGNNNGDHQFNQQVFGQSGFGQNPNSSQAQQGHQNFYGNGSAVDLGNVVRFAENPMVQQFVGAKVQGFQEEVASKYLPGASSLWNSLRYYFHVDNKYVLKKLQLLVFPWRQKEWARIRVGDETVEGPSQTRVSDFAPPVGDVNAPDLYLPSMAFVTYILFIGFLKGTKRTFNPEVLQDTFSTSALTLLLEVLLMKGGLYSLGAASIKIAWLDLCVYAGYKYVNVALCLLIGIFLGTSFYNVFMLYFCLSTAFFTFQTMKKAIPKPGMEASGHKRRLYFLLACAGLQLLTIFFLGFTRDLGETTLFLGGSSEQSSLSSKRDVVESNEADV